MVNVRTTLLILTIFVIALIFISLNTLSNHNVINIKTNDSSLQSPNPSPSLTNNNSISNPGITLEQSIDDNLSLPSKECILENIHWSNYTLIANPYIHNYEISDPTDVINHKFLYVTLVVEVKDARNKEDVLKQLSGVVLEEQKILGPNSAPNIWGTVDGVWVYYAAIRPYETDVLARYLH